MSKQDGFDDTLMAKKLTSMVCKHETIVTRVFRTLCEIDPDCDADDTYRPVSIFCESIEPVEIVIDHNAVFCLDCRRPITEIDPQPSWTTRE